MEGKAHQPIWSHFEMHAPWRKATCCFCSQQFSYKVVGGMNSLPKHFTTTANVAALQKAKVEIDEASLWTSLSRKWYAVLLVLASWWHLSTQLDSTCILSVLLTALIEGRSWVFLSLGNVYCHLPSRSLGNAYRHVTSLSLGNPYHHIPSLILGNTYHGGPPLFPSLVL